MQQHQTQQLRATAERRQSDVSQAVLRAGQQHEDTIENADADSQVNNDGGGTGGQGRAFHEQPQPDSPDPHDIENKKSGITSDGDGQIHLDITA